MALLVSVGAAPAGTSTSGEGAPIPVLSEMTSVVSEGARSIIVDVPASLRVNQDIPRFGLDVPFVEIDDVDSFVALTLVSVDEGPGMDLPKIVATKLPLPAGPAVFFAVVAPPELDDEFPAGRYQLTVIAEATVSVDVTLAGLPEGTQQLVPTDEAGYGAEVVIQEPTPAGVFASAFSAGVEHTTTATSQTYFSVWVAGAVEGAARFSSCQPYGQAPSALGLYTPGCGVGGGENPAITTLTPQLDFIEMLYGWYPTASPRHYNVGGYYDVAGVSNGGGLMYLWVDAAPHNQADDG